MATDPEKEIDWQHYFSVVSALRQNLSGVVSLGEQRANVLLVATTILAAAYLQGAKLFGFSEKTVSSCAITLGAIAVVFLIIGLLLALLAVTPNIHHWIQHHKIYNLLTYSSIQRFKNIEDFHKEFRPLMINKEKLFKESLKQIHGIAHFAHWKITVLALGVTSTGLSCLFAISAAFYQIFAN